MMKRVFLLISIFAWTILFATGNTQSAYEERSVTKGGTIVGEVLYKGDIPPVEQLTVTKNEDFCGKSKPSERMLIDSSGGVKNSIITIENISKGKKFDKSAQPYLDNNQCQFVPHVQVVPLGSNLQIRNSDPILHNTHGSIGQTTLFNLALPLQGQKINKSLRKSGIVEFMCDSHSWMSAYVFVTQNPYYAVTDEKGTFQITDVPPGTYKLKIWHEALGEQIKEVKVIGGKEVKITFTYTGK